MIRLENLSKKYGKKEVLKNVNLEIPSGKRIAITGKNGSGKSTLLKLMAGVERPTSGTIIYYNQEVTGNRRLFMKYAGYVPQGDPLLSELSVLDNLRLFQEGKKEVSKTVIEMNGLEDFLHQRVDTLSGGMKRRVTIACAMLATPPVMLLDEPTASLDTFYKEKIWIWMEQYIKMGGTIFLVSHDKAEIDACDIIYDMSSLNK